MQFIYHSSNIHCALDLLHPEIGRMFTFLEEVLLLAGHVDVELPLQELDLHVLVEYDFALRI